MSLAQHQLADFEEFELNDYVGTQELEAHSHRAAALEAPGGQRRQEKVRKLDEADEMKFSHSIQFNAVPDWSSHYIAYSNLKKL